MAVAITAGAMADAISTDAVQAIRVVIIRIPPTGAGMAAIVKMRKMLTRLVAVCLLGGCGASDEKQASVEPKPMPSPTGYHIMAKDIYREQPRDICRQKNDMFVSDLVSRIDRALRKAELGSVENFDNFNVQPNETGKGGQQAAVWVHAVYKGEPNTTVVAVGSFDAADCHVGPMKAGNGSEAWMLPAKRTIIVD